MNAANARKTHCDKDHEFTPENTYLQPGGGRACRTCKRAAGRKSMQASRDRAKARRTVVKAA